MNTKSALGLLLILLTALACDLTGLLADQPTATKLPVWASGSNTSTGTNMWTGSNNFTGPVTFTGTTALGTVATGTLSGTLGNVIFTNASAYDVSGTAAAVLALSKNANNLNSGTVPYPQLPVGTGSNQVLSALDPRLMTITTDGTNVSITAPASNGNVNLVTSGSGQVFQNGYQFFNASSIADPDVISYIQRAGGFNVFTTAELFMVSNLAANMKAHGTWGNMIAYYPCAGSGTASHAQNLISSSYTLNFVGNWKFAAWGMQNDGVQGCVETGIVPVSVFDTGTADNGIRSWAIGFDLLSGSGRGCTGVMSDMNTYRFSGTDTTIWTDLMLNAPYGSGSFVGNAGVSTGNYQGLAWGSGSGRPSTLLSGGSNNQYTQGQWTLSVLPYTTGSANPNGNRQGWLYSGTNLIWSGTSTTNNNWRLTAQGQIELGTGPANSTHTVASVSSNSAYGSFFVANIGLTPADILSLNADVVQSRLDRKAIFPATPPCLVLGDSIVHGYLTELDGGYDGGIYSQGGWMRYLGQLNIPGSVFTNYRDTDLYQMINSGSMVGSIDTSFGGDSLLAFAAAMSSGTGTVNGLPFSTYFQYTKRVLINLGTNDIGLNAQTGTQCYSSLLTIVRSGQAYGATTFDVTTLLPRSDWPAGSVKDGYRLYYNSQVMALSGSMPNVVNGIDLANIPASGTFPAVTTGTTYIWSQNLISGSQSPYYGDVTASGSGMTTGTFIHPSDLMDRNILIPYIAKHWK